MPADASALPASCRRPDSGKGDVVVPYVIRKVPLGDVSYLAKAGGQPDTFVRFSPDGRLLAVGTFLGRIKLLDVYANRTLWDKRIAEGIVKQIDFSPDGKQLYYGEQSVDGFLYAADAGSGETLWRFRLADDLETSPPPPKDSLYGVYQLPACFRLKTLADGDLLVLGLHCWGDHTRTESMTRLCRVYRFSPEGTVRWAFPADGPMPLGLIHMDGDRAGRRVAVLAASTAGNTPHDCPYRPGSIYVLDGRTGKLVGGHTFEPLEPHFEQVQFWQSVSVGPQGKLASLGLHDGRTFLVDLDTAKPEKTFAFGAPIPISGVPVSARSTYTLLAPDSVAYFQTANSTVPYVGRRQHVVAPPGPHPWANHIHAVGLDGQVRWRYQSGHEYQNFWTSADGRWMLTCVNKDDKRTGRDSGAMLFDTRRPGGGTAKLVYPYQVEGLTFFHADLARDGSALAVVEVPYQDPETGMLVGFYQVHVVR
jgi:outer membrane protein assembly factor BamB